MTNTDTGPGVSASQAANDSAAELLGRIAGEEDARARLVPALAFALADALVRSAVLATAAVGVAGGAVTAVKWTVPVTLLTLPLQLAVETAAVAAIEIKLVAELHEVYGVAVSGTGTQRGPPGVAGPADGRPSPAPTTWWPVRAG